MDPNRMTEKSREALQQAQTLRRWPPEINYQGAPTQKISVT